jgi:Trypsin-co-occurring domain 1
MNSGIMAKVFFIYQIGQKFMKNLLEFKLDNGESAFVQIEEPESQVRQRVSRGGADNTNVQAERTFSQALSCIAPVGNALLTSLKDINTPDEIQLEFGLTFNANAGVIFTSAGTEASFKVSITWKNK